uniref:Uncharacterized protein n=1 Tax=Vespula pensylvanica TaxID=30213 RepID=A0A834N747_VESPE|nr:hypothetical protein H0235_016365 [Vespula pensylvanica]
MRSRMTFRGGTTRRDPRLKGRENTRTLEGVRERTRNTVREGSLDRSSAAAVLYVSSGSGWWSVEATTVAAFALLDENANVSSEIDISSFFSSTTKLCDGYTQRTMEYICEKTRDVMFWELRSFVRPKTPVRDNGVPQALNMYRLKSVTAFRAIPPNDRAFLPDAFNG